MSHFNEVLFEIYSSLLQNIDILLSPVLDTANIKRGKPLHINSEFDNQTVPVHKEISATGSVYSQKASDIAILPATQHEQAVDELAVSLSTRRETLL